MTHTASHKRSGTGLFTVDCHAYNAHLSGSKEIFVIARHSEGVNPAKADDTAQLPL